MSDKNPLQKRERKQTAVFLLKRACILLDFLLLVPPMAYAWWEYYAPRMYLPFFFWGNFAVMMVYIMILFLSCNLYDVFQIATSRITGLIYSEIVATFVADFIFFFVVWLESRRFPAIWPTVVVWLIQVVLAVPWAYIAHHWYYLHFKPKKTVVVWDMREGLEELIRTYDLEIHYAVIATPHITDVIHQKMKPLRDAEAIFLCGIHSHERNQIIKYAVDHGISCYVIPRVGDVVMSGATKLHLFHLPILRVDRFSPDLEYYAIKRAIDIILSLIALILLSPLLLIICIAIKATDGGDILYRQTRLTKDGKIFKILKFRTMRMNAESDGVARLSTGDHDDRITPVGRILRKVRFDELPQLINILKGEMTIVGPRPERPEIAAEYEKELPEFRLRLQVKAGLTGYAQVYGKYNTTPYDKLLMDLMYIAKPSFAEDFKIILATIKILLLPESTEGVEEGKRTADK